MTEDKWFDEDNRQVKYYDYSNGTINLAIFSEEAWDFEKKLWKEKDLNMTFETFIRARLEYGGIKA